MARLEFARLSRWVNPLEKITVLETEKALSAFMGTHIEIVTSAKIVSVRESRH